MAKITKRSFNAYPEELVPSLGVNEIQDNIILVSKELWMMANLMKEGDAGFIPLMFSYVNGIPSSERTTNMQFEYDTNGNIIRAYNDNKEVRFIYDINEYITSVYVRVTIGDYILEKTYTFGYNSDGDIINMAVE